ncbi:hypothetical protein [Nocardia sp. NPDC058497]
MRYAASTAVGNYATPTTSADTEEAAAGGAIAHYPGAAAFISTAD